MKRIVILGFALALVAPTAHRVDAQGNTLSFFITSTNPGKGGGPRRARGCRRALRGAGQGRRRRQSRSGART